MHAIQRWRYMFPHSCRCASQYFVLCTDKILRVIVLRNLTKFLVYDPLVGSRVE